jgi:sensor histidine kinase YesM
LELEHLRFNDKFDYKIEIDETIDTDSVLMPNMLLQPHLENAIWHGLRYKESKGLLLLSFKHKNSFIEITIEDDGIGIDKSKALKTQNQKVHQSIGLKNISERTKLLNELYHIKINSASSNKPNDKGTIITLQIPFLHKV